MVKKPRITEIDRELLAKEVFPRSSAPYTSCPGPVNYSLS